MSFIRVDHFFSPRRKRLQAVWILAVNTKSPSVKRSLFSAQYVWDKCKSAFNVLLRVRIHLTAGASCDSHFVDTPRVTHACFKIQLCNL